MIFDLLTSPKSRIRLLLYDQSDQGLHCLINTQKKVHAVSIYILSMTTADDKGRCIFLEAGEGLKVVAWQKFDLQKWSLLDRLYMMQQFL